MTTVGYADPAILQFSNGTFVSVSPIIVILQKILPGLIGVFCTVGLLCNGFIIVLLLTYSNMKTLANTFIFNLALADFFFMFTFPFLGHQMWQSEWIFGRVLCRILVPYDTMTQFTVVFFLVVMGVDRYLAICHPIRSMHYRTIFNGRVVSVMVWICSFLVSLPVWIYTDQITYYGNGQKIHLCLALATKHNEDVNNFSWWIIYTLFFDFCAPLTIIFVCYFLIIWNLRHSPLQDIRNTSRRASRKVAILVICIVFVFVSCFLPFFIIQFIQSQTDPSEFTDALLVAFVVSWFLMYSHSIINPIVYTMLGENFRQNLPRLCRSIFHRKRSNSRQSSMRTSSMYLRRSRGSIKSCNSSTEGTGRIHTNGYLSISPKIAITHPPPKRLPPDDPV
ncbi:somatostatin receptor type 5-like [Lytechinus pictus]|uniref:somatostatin receptor type 5-like n=1 Tax=Lytechinus pictus TaxID=7653 RepID=UPI00240D5B74|nr:somatostatin receptor type 5-like [Lytechinus pictus]